MTSRIADSLKQLASNLGGTYNGVLVHIRNSNRDFEVRFYDSIGGSRYSSSSIVPSSLAVVTGVKTATVFDFFNESLVDKFFKALAIEKEYQSGYPEFDNKLLLKIGNETVARSLFSDSAIRNAMLLVFKSGFTRISCDGNELVAEVIPMRSLEINPADVSNAILCLALLAGKI